MKQVFSIFFALFLVALATGSTPCAQAATRNLSPSQAYQLLVQERDTLVKNAAKAASRQYWEEIEQGFAGLASSQAGDVGPQSLFQAAQTREMLARRSAAASDYRRAAEAYARFAQNYPRYAWLDRAVYNQARIQGQNLGNPSGGLELLQNFEKRFPQSSLSPQAGRLRAELNQTAASLKEPPKKEAQAAKAEAEKTRPANSRAQPANNHAQPANSPGDRRAAQENPAEAQKVYEAARKEFTALGNSPKGKQREAWLSLNERLQSVARLAPSSPAAEKADFLSARTWESLALRSAQKADWQEAAGRFANFAARYPESTLADDALYQQAQILVRRLNDKEQGTTALENMFAAYPQGDKFTEGMKLYLNNKPAGGRPLPAGRVQRGQTGTLAEQLGMTVRTIMIDPGHGGKDPGAKGNSIVESAYVYELSRQLGAKLSKAGFTVMYTREKNVFIPLEDRTKLANANKADLFISLHVNANKDSAVNGIETYYLDVAKSDSAARIAARENGLTTQEISDLQFILSELSRDAKLKESRELSEMVLDGIVKNLGDCGLACANNGARSAPFYVLLGARMPAILIEVGYLSNPAEARRMNNPAYISRVADGIVNGVLNYKRALNQYGTASK